MNDTDQNEETTEESAVGEETTPEVKSQKPKLNTTRGWDPRNKHFDHEASTEQSAAPRKSPAKKVDRKKKKQMAKKSRRTNRK